MWHPVQKLLCMKKRQNSKSAGLSGVAVSGSANTKSVARDKLTPSERQALNVLIHEALMQQAAHGKEKMYKEECAHAVIATLGEFLASYMLIGYDFEGTPIRIVSAKTGMEADALAHAVQNYIMMSHFNNDNNL